jgi:hypothetical protein
MLALVSRVFLMAGLTPDQVGRKYMQTLNAQGAIGVERMVSEEHRKPQADSLSAAVSCDHYSMAWTMFFKHKQIRTDAHDFLLQGGGELFVVLGTWTQKIHARIQTDMQSRDQNMQLVQAGAGGGQGPGRRPPRWEQAAVQWVCNIQFVGDWGILHPVFQLAMGMGH